MRRELANLDVLVSYVGSLVVVEEDEPVVAEGVLEVDVVVGWCG